MTGGSLSPIPIEFLFDGLDVEEDIYDADCLQIVAKRGVRLDADSIEAIRKFNKNRSVVYVSSGTYKALTKDKSPLEIMSRRKMEESTGYTVVKDQTLQMLNDIANNKTVHEESLRSVSEELSNRLEVIESSSVLALINALAPVDEYLQRHCINVSLLNGLQGRWLGLPKDAVDALVLIGLLHDCGKALMPARILNAPRKLTVVEYEVIKMHPVHTYELLSGFPETVRLAARLHHEKVNGCGYPDSLPEGKIPVEARITAVSDIYDAMVSRRAYKDPKSPFSIISMMMGLRNSELDTLLVDVFALNMPKDLIDKPVKLSDGSIGVVRDFDPQDPEYPVVEVGGKIFKTSSRLNCVSMHMEE